MESLNRRPNAGALRLAVAVASALSLAACDGGGGTDEPPDGTFEKPWTRDAPAEGVIAETHFPVVYAALVNQTSVRLWIEILDPNTNTFHDQNVNHFVEQIHVEDEFANKIASQGYLYDSGARMIAQVEIPEGVESISVFQKCNTTGWWKTTYAVADLKVAPVGDVRRPLTAAQPGDFGDKIDIHVPKFGKRPDGKYSVEVGDRAAGKLHEMTDQHYIKTVLIFDEYHQLRAGTYLDPDYNPEPVYDFDAVGGTGFVRVVAECNLHKWWEGVYSLQGL